MSDTNPNESPEAKKVRLEKGVEDANKVYEEKVTVSEKKGFQKFRETIDKHPGIKAAALLGLEGVGIGATMTAADVAVLVEAIDDFNHKNYDKALLRATIALVPGPVSELDPLIDKLPDHEDKVAQSQTAPGMQPA